MFSWRRNLQQKVFMKKYIHRWFIRYRKKMSFWLESSNKGSQTSEKMGNLLQRRHEKHFYISWWKKNNNKSTIFFSTWIEKQSWARREKKEQILSINKENAIKLIDYISCNQKYFDNCVVQYLDSVVENCNKLIHKRNRKNDVKLLYQL